MAKKNNIAKPEVSAIRPVEQIESLILTIRGKQVMLDRDLARLYGIETKVLNQAVKRNVERFPEDFMFQLTKDEFENWKSQFATSILDDEDISAQASATIQRNKPELGSLETSKTSRNHLFFKPRFMHAYVPA